MCCGGGVDGSKSWSTSIFFKGFFKPNFAKPA
jgi:hypothetical protein